MLHNFSKLLSFYFAAIIFWSDLNISTLYNELLWRTNCIWTSIYSYKFFLWNLKCSTDLDLENSLTHLGALSFIILETPPFGEVDKFSIFLCLTAWFRGQGSGDCGIVQILTYYSEKYFCNVILIIANCVPLH